MNCEEYKQAIGADPSYEGGGEHLAHCGDCQAYRQDMLELDGRIKRALSLRVPELMMPELPEIETADVVSLDTRRRVTAPAWFAIAASVTLAVFVGVRTLGPAPDDGSVTLAAQIVEHLEHEPGAFRVTDRGVSEQRLARVVPADIATLDHSAGLITYAQSCKINGVNVPHLVLQGEQGPVTILLMPGQPVDGASEFSGESIKGVIIPVGSGSIAIIGEAGEDLGRIEKNVKHSVTWDT